MTTLTAPAHGRDWRYRVDYQEGKTLQTPEQLATLRCPFRLTPETIPGIPDEYTKGLHHFISSPSMVMIPWTGYYAPYKRAQIAVANAYGVWFEITRRNSEWSAIRPARSSLHLNNWPCDGINLAALEASGEPTPVSRASSKARTEDGEEEEEVAPPTRTEPRSSLTQRGGRKPRGTGDDPYTLGDLDGEDKPSGNGRLEGVVPTAFDGDRSKTMKFLTDFKSFMLMNEDARIAKNPMKRCAYFLSLIQGTQVEGWSLRQHDWLDKLRKDATILPWNMNAWDVLEQEFRKSFIDYAANERAFEELRKLRMKDGRIDEYIADFRRLIHMAGLDENEGSNIRMFAQGLPSKLAENVIDTTRPQTFEEWAQAAQFHQQGWMYKQSLKNIFGPSQQTRDNSRQGNSSQGRLYWNSWRGGRGGQNRGQGRNPRNAAPHDPNAMDTSAGAIRKAAVTNAEKEKYKAE